MMRVLFDVTHPALAHTFKHAIRGLQERGHIVRVVSRRKDLTTDLLDACGIAHTPISSTGDHPLSLLFEWPARAVRMVRVARSFDPDVVVSQLDPAAVQVARLVGARSVVFDDSEREQLAGRLTHPFADVICTPAGFDRDLGPRQRRYDGYHELAYLHPDRFEPQPSVLRAHDVDPTEPYAVLRFVSWRAHHDVGQSGLSRSAKRDLVSELDAHGSVYITSEDPLPDAFEPYRLPVPPEAVHQLLFHADLYVGDSQTMATEAAVLGTPAVRTNSFVDRDMSNFIELEERYGLLYSTADEQEALDRVRTLVSDPETEATWRRRRERLLADKRDVTAFVLDVILEANR